MIAHHSDYTWGDLFSSLTCFLRLWQLRCTNSTTVVQDECWWKEVLVSLTQWFHENFVLGGNGSFCWPALLYDSASAGKVLEVSKKYFKLLGPFPMYDTILVMMVGPLSIKCRESESREAKTNRSMSQVSFMCLCRESWREGMQRTTSARFQADSSRKLHDYEVRSDVENEWMMNESIESNES